MHRHERGGGYEMMIMNSLAPPPPYYGAQEQMYGLPPAEIRHFHHEHRHQVYGQAQHYLPPMEAPPPYPSPGYGGYSSNGYHFGPGGYNPNANPGYESSIYQPPPMYPPPQYGGYPQQSFYPTQGMPQPGSIPHYHHKHHERHHFHRSIAPGYPHPYENHGVTYDGAHQGSSADACKNAKVVAQVAEQMGVDPVVAVAAMLVESGGNACAVGDHGNAFGLFQLNRHGELGDAHLTPAQAADPFTNACVALSHFQRGQCYNPGAMAAAAQKPADRVGYAKLVNSRLAEARRLLQQQEYA